MQMTPEQIHILKNKMNCYYAKPCDLFFLRTTLKEQIEAIDARLLSYGISPQEFELKTKRESESEREIKRRRITL